MSTERRASLRLTLAFLTVQGMALAGACAPRNNPEATIDPPKVVQSLEQTDYPPSHSILVSEFVLKMLFGLTDEEAREFELANESKKYLPELQPQNVYRLYDEDFKAISLRYFQGKSITPNSEGEERLSKLCQESSLDDLLETTGEIDWPLKGMINQWPNIRHPGIDLEGLFGQEVPAADGGIVVGRFESDSGYGFHLVINHGRGRFTNSAHLSKMVVQVGDKVGKGSVIGMVGSTGNSTGPHLHFEIIEKDGENCSFINPLLYLP